MPNAITHDEMISAEESLIADVQVVIHNLMLERRISRADLARALGVSDARVSQMFSDAAPNLTLRTIARVFRVLGEECRFTSDRWEEILGVARESEEAANSSELAEPISFDFEGMLQTLDRLETGAREAYSNDNFRAAALAA